MQSNTVKAPVRTHQGAKARHIRPIDQLRRSVMSCLLFEREFYESGEDIGKRIAVLVSECDPQAVEHLANEARSVMNLRHVPLWMLAVLARQGRVRADAVAQVVQRPDEMGELLAMIAALNDVGPDRVKKVLSNQVKLGLARAFTKFDAYQLAKYNRPKAITLRDVMFLVHPKPKDKTQARAFKALAEGSLEAPGTWENRLSAGEDAGKVWTELLKKGTLGYMALLRNLRNMEQAGVDPSLVADAIIARKGGAERVLPFRYVAAARACPHFEPALDQALMAALDEQEPLKGRTVVLVDVSQSMTAKLSARSDITRMDAAATLASMVTGQVRVFTFSDGGRAFRTYGYRRTSGGPVADGRRVAIPVPPRRGMAGVDAVINSQAHGGTLLGQAVREINEMPHDRLIVITDEQSHDPVPDPVCDRAYMINVASNQNGVGYGKWTHIDGWSDGVLRYIQAIEAD